MNPDNPLIVERGPLYDSGTPITTCIIDEYQFELPGNSRQQRG
jgi:hypothetical protein